MITKFQKTVKSFIITFFLFSTAFYALLPNTNFHITQAQTFKQHAPSFALYCYDETIINGVSVDFELHESAKVKQGKGTLKAVYNIANTNNTVDFAIPFLSSVINVPIFNVSANEQKVTGTIIYGDAFTDYDGANYTDLIKDLQISQIDDTIGTLYTIIPDNDIIDIEFSFAEGKSNSIVYETSNHFSSSSSSNGQHSWSLKNALSKDSYTFYIVGNGEDHSFSSSCEYQSLTMTCKEFIERQYEIENEMYSEYNISLDFFYALFNKTLQKRNFIKYDDMFYNSLNVNRFNIYKFSLSLNEETTVSYELPIEIQCNDAFNPPIYLVEQKHLNNYPINYNIKLNSDTPLIIEASVKTQKSDMHYTAETTEDFYFVFCALENPKDAFGSTNNSKRNRTLLAICISVICIAVIGAIILTIILLHKRKNK